MILLDEHQLPAWLRARSLLGPSEPCRVEALSGGVSNVVLRVEAEHRPPMVVKQSRERLQTAAPWYSRLDRIFRETAVMRAIRPLLPAGAIPKILDEDRENFAYAMQACDASHVVWKGELLTGRVREQIAIRLADYLSSIHGRTAGNWAIAEEFADQEIFEQLRVSPFYRHVAREGPELAAPIAQLIDEMGRNRVCLVHADFSPKNVLVVDRSATDESAQQSLDSASRLEVTLIDFETGHYGDPAFDLGFFLSHLLLKGVRVGPDLGQFLRLADVFLGRYFSGIASVAAAPGFEPGDLERRAIAHLAACALARIDGTSPVDYLTDPADQQAVRDFGGQLFGDSVTRLAEAGALLDDILKARRASGYAAVRPADVQSAPKVASRAPAP